MKVKARHLGAARAYVFPIAAVAAISQSMMTTQSPPVDPGGAASVGTLESFMYFPSPLALLNREGQLELANTRFAQSLGRAEIDPKRLAEVARGGDSDWHSLGPGGEGGPRVRAVKTPHRVLIIVEDRNEARSPGLLDALLNRVKELEQLVATDHLTGAWNRTHFDRVIRAEITRSLSYRQPLSLLLMEVDGFKQISETGGQAAGDAVLCALANVVKSRIRASDLLFRWEGARFVILISATGYRHAETVAETLRSAVLEHRFAQAGTISVSFGVAELEGNEDAEAWFARLEHALQTAKSNGRNRVAVERTGNSDTWAAERGTSALHLEWLEGYECGNAVIDAEHREIFELANALIDASLREPFEPAVFKAALSNLLDHVERHFADEETILKDYCYAQFEDHRRSHAGLLLRARRFQKLAGTGEFSMAGVVEFLAQELVARHLRIVDRGFFPLFAKERA
jgi:diguanylate cyclase (GGDEF)-like protein/hemerythrin-like metal-binding protein